MPFVTIVRRDRHSADSYEQTFEFSGSLERTVINLLQELNSRETLTDTAGNIARRIVFECACKDSKCGACAMLIGDEPRLACEVTLRSCMVNGTTFRLAPLSKFPCVCDLMVDRTALEARAAELNLFLTEEVRPVAAPMTDCIYCGLCVEACHKHGERFDGPMVYSAAALMLSLDPTRKKDLKKSLAKPMLCPCGKGSCEAVCPMHLPLREAIKSISGSLMPIVKKD